MGQAIRHVKKVWSWALYDWANSAFATTVMAGFFPLFFKRYWGEGLPVSESTFMLGVANSIASIAVAVFAPLLGAIADQGSAKKRFLMFFAVMGIVMTGSLYLVAEGGWLLAIVLYIFAIIGFSGGNIFYDALLPGLAAEERLDVVSALGFALGYLGGGLLFALNVSMTLWPQIFGLTGSAEAVRVSFLMVAAWWAVFSIPVFLFVPEPAWVKPGGHVIRTGLGQLRATFHEVRRLKAAFLFLVAYWLYIDGVDTVIRMAVDYGLSLGFSANALIVALLITQFVGFPAVLLFGKLGERLGAKTGLYIGISVYIGVTIWAYFIDSVAGFYAVAVAIGLVQGGVQALSRSLYARLIPKDMTAEFFGFYNMLGRFAVVIGPVLMGYIGLLTGSPRLSILSVLALFIAGLIVLRFVDVKEGRLAAGHI